MNYLKKIFQGRINRKDFTLGILTLSFIVFIVNLIVSSIFQDSIITIILTSIVFLIYIVFVLSIHARRLHDQGNSSFWILLWIIPIAGFVMFLFLIFKKGDDKENIYGQIPKGTFLNKLFLYK